MKNLTLTVNQNDLKFFVTAGITADGIIVNTTDLLVLTMFQDTMLGEGPAVLDKQLGGAITQGLSQSTFKGKLGEDLIIDSGHISASPVKHVMLLGLGRSRDFGQPVICAAYQRILDTAQSLAAKRATLVVFPNRLANQTMNLSAAFAVLACRILRAQNAETLGSLKEVEILASHQARRSILAGLDSPCQLCTHCPNPCLPKS